LSLLLKHYTKKVTLTCLTKKYSLGILMYVLTPQIKRSRSYWNTLGKFILFTICFETGTRRTESFTAEWTLLCVPSFMADPAVDGRPSKQFCYLGFYKKSSSYWRYWLYWVKWKGIFSALNFILPVDKNALPMHCSSNVG
jgi:ATP-dependent phosphoenolpyruvate carboxykinase